jgi:uncharacterized membrane protein SpoIIM required for sporulation
MAEITLKSFQFRREREASWRELEEILRKMERRSARALTPQELMRLPTLYRAVLSSLSVARSISLDQGLLAYLENLANRTYFQIYGPRTTLLRVVIDFAMRGFPQAVRSLRWHIALAAFLIALGGFVGYRLYAADTDWYYTFMPDGMTGGRTPTTTTEDLHKSVYGEVGVEEAGWLPAFGSFLFIHNTGVSIAAFALGVAFGLPTVWFMLYNGLMLGVFIALYADRGLGPDIGGWLIIHGSTELLAVALCGGAGLALADALIFAERRGRLAAFAERGRIAGIVVTGAICMLLVAGALEGLGRQLILDEGLRYAIGIVMAIFWLTLFLRGGRRASNDGCG